MLFRFRFSGQAFPIMPHVRSVLQTNFVRTFNLKQDPNALGTLSCCCETGSQTSARKLEADLRRPACAFRSAARTWVASLGGRNPARYCESKARRAASTVAPMPTIPSSTVGPRRAIQRPLRMNNLGRRTADGLPQCAAQYLSISSVAVRAGLAGWRPLVEAMLAFFLICYLNAGSRSPGCNFLFNNATPRPSPVSGSYEVLTYI